MKYYSENIEKNTKYRQSYKESIDKFLEKEKQNADIKRSLFINPDLCYKNQKYYRKKLIELLGFPLNKKNLKGISVQTIFVAEDGNVDIYRKVFSIDGIEFYGIYFKQKEDFSKKPFALCFHGGWGTPETISSIYDDSRNYNHLARRLTDKGFSVFCPQLLLWNIDKYGNKYDRQEIDSKLRQLGGSITALELWLIKNTLNYFIKNEQINKDEMYSIGLSYGGMYALNYSAIDERIKGCYASSQFNDRFKYSWSDWSYKNALNQISDAEVASLVCPRKLCISLGNKDEVFNYEYAKKGLEEVKKYYSKFNANDNYLIDIFDGTHETSKNNNCIDFLLK